jgi:hypothetical protein
MSTYLAKKDSELRKQLCLKYVPLLLEHHGISGHRTNTWKRLAFALMRTHVPAFSLWPLPVSEYMRPEELFGISTEWKRGVGAPRKWSEAQYTQLLDAVERGKSILRQKGRRPTVVGALQEILRLNSPTSNAVAVLKAAKLYASRVSDAQKFLRKL